MGNMHTELSGKQGNENITNGPKRNWLKSTEGEREDGQGY